MNLKFQRFTDYYVGVPLCYGLYFLKEAAKRFKGKKASKPVRKILMIKFWGIGNLIMILPTIKAVKEHYPDARLDIFTLSQNKGALDDNPHLNNIYLLKNDRFFSFIKTFFGNIIRLRQEDYDMILDFEQFAKTSTIFSLLVGQRERVGFDTAGQMRGIAYTKKVAYLDYTHMVETFFRIAKGAGVEKADLSPVPLVITEDEKRAVDLFLEKNRICADDMIVGMHLGSGENMLPRRWEKEKFAALSDRLIEKYKVNVIFTGHGPDEERLVDEAISLAKFKIVNAAGKLKLKELAELIRRCKFFVSNDTAPVHIASSMETPVVAFYGPNTPYLYGPRGKNNLVFYRDPYCSPCITNYNAKISKCVDPKCINEISVEEVFEGIENSYFS